MLNRFSEKIMNRQPLEIPDDYRLPFQITGPDFINWIKSQGAHIDINNAKGLYYVLKTLNRTHIRLETRLQILLVVNAILPKLSDYLVNEFIGEAIPLQSLKLDYATLTSGLYNELSKSFHLAITSKEFLSGDSISINQKNKIIYLGLNACNNAILNFSLSYYPVETGFWKRTYDIFTLANSLGISKQKINAEGQSIENVFKSILAFHFSSPNQYQPDELLSVAKIINRFSEYGSLMSPAPEKKYLGLPVVILGEDTPPYYRNPEKADQVGAVYVATANLAAHIFEYFSKKEKSEPLDHVNLSKMSALRLVKSLSLSSRRKSERQTTEQFCSVIVGFHNLCQFLSPNKSKFESKELSIEPYHGNNDLASGVFINPAYKTNTFYRQKNDGCRQLFEDRLALGNRVKSINIWNDAKNAVRNKNNKITDVSTSGFGIVLGESEIKLRVSDLIGITDNDFRLLGIGLVRRIGYVGQALKIGVEILSTEAGFVNASTLLVDNDDLSEGISWTNENEKYVTEAILSAAINPNLNQTIFIQKNSFNRKYYKVMGILNKNTNYLHCRLAEDRY